MSMKYRVVLRSRIVRAARCVTFGSVLLLISILMNVLAVHHAYAASIVVNSLADIAANDGVCTLQEAIQSANLNTVSGVAVGECVAGSNDPTVDVITFSLGGTITVTSALPGIGSVASDDPGYVTIDGDNNDDLVPDIVLDRNSGGGDGLLIGRSAAAAVNVTIRGLNIREFGAQGIDVARAQDLVIEDSYIHAGTNQGIRINDAATIRVTIRRVRIGFDGNGAASGNGSNGIQINQGADSVTIEDSFIGANGDTGIQIAGGGDVGSGHMIRRNFIGTNLTGTTCGNLAGGPPHNTFGNGLIGIHINGGVTLSTFEDNVIGCNGRRQSGTAPQGDGIEFNSGASDNHTIEGNFIGTNSAGADLGNIASGIDIIAGDLNTIIGNTIAFNGFISTGSHQHGIEITGTGSDGHTITQNSIYGNDGLGIDLGTDGVNANDALDPDSGANALQNYPVINSAANNGAGMYAVNYTWSFKAGEGPWVIEFFCNSNGDSEGRSYQASVTIPSGTPTGTQTSSFTPVPGTCNTTANVITATATNGLAGGSTSEFSSTFNPTAIILTDLRASATSTQLVNLCLAIMAFGGLGLAWILPRHASSRLNRREQRAMLRWVEQTGMHRQRKRRRS